MPPPSPFYVLSLMYIFMQSKSKIREERCFWYIFVSNFNLCKSFWSVLIAQMGITQYVATLGGIAFHNCILFYLEKGVHYRLKTCKMSSSLYRWRSEMKYLIFRTRHCLNAKFHLVIWKRTGVTLLYVFVLNTCIFVPKILFLTRWKAWQD